MKSETSVGAERSGSADGGRWLPVATLFLILTALAAAAGGQSTGTVSGTVSGPGDAPISGATVMVVETQRSVVTGRDGTYSIHVSPGEHTILATASGYETDQQRVTVQAGSELALDFSLDRALSQFGEELVVIGSRSHRTAIETPVPVDVLSEDDIQESGQTETSRIIQFLAPSFNFSTSTISDGTDIVRPSTLRGLGPDQTLVLINGKRRHNSALVHVNGSIGRGTAGVDLNAIPAAAIERIEVLRDGAAAQYGSDAIAGVINIVLKEQVDVTQIELQAGQTYESDGEVVNASINRGWRIGERGFFNLTADYRDRDPTNRAGRDPRRIFNFLEQQLFQPELTSGTLDPREQTYDRLNHRYGDARSENAGLFFNSAIPVGESDQFYFFGGFTMRDGESAGFNRLPRQSRTNIFIHPEGHLPLINTNVDDLSLAAGYRKNLGENWSLDASVVTGGNSFEFIITNSANTSLGPASPDHANAGELKFDQTTVNLDFFGTIQTAKPLYVAFGAEYRQDNYEIVAGEPASWIDGGFPDQFGGRAPAGIQVFPGFRPANEVDVSRDNVAVYGDLEVNLSEKFLLGAAVRFEDYSDFGNTTTGKLALRYAFSEKFALRASASTGFRAPSLHQANFNNTSTQFVFVGGELVPLEVGTFRNDDPVTRAFGVPRLKEETSTNLSFGFTARPFERLSITADAYSIDIDDRIVISGQFRATNPQIAPILAPFGVNAAQFFSNAIDTETEGIDLVVAYVWPLADGSSLSVTGAANWTGTDVVGPVRTPPTLQGLGETLFDRRERVFVERGQPQEHYNLSARYERGPFAVLARLNKFGAVVTAESASNPGIDQTFTGKWLADLDVSYRFNDYLKLSVGGNNVFDTFPDRNRPEISFNGIFPFPRRTAPFGFNGGDYYLRLSLTF
ncbi:MAG: TonB-dependent receptor [Acidobacteria bacterium]|nr:MAG: TonB-dependent receptor [Acidobacteriota bacterium]